ncbi:peptidoglycan endopeptidase [Flavobacterium sp. 83]|uniref:peptidoglycan endopeptidase n=1 Tax=Flavobacterium sp. 83 TaxID=1131812 RepID=UPI00054F93F7|nr:peptidoglycan endopeptidase [Flavobacterium sp. 83]
MSLRLVVTLFLLNSIVLFSQESTKKHTIVKGETISSIAEKYDVKQSEIYKLNPKAKNLLKLNSVLLIPTIAPKNTDTKSKIAKNYQEKEHEVLAKETLYGIAKQYGVTVKELNEANPSIETSGLKIGQKLEIPGNATSSEIAVVTQTKKSSPKTAVPIETQITETENPITEVTSIEVLPKESKYSIARKYGITIKELDKVNPTIGVKSLRVGQKINVPANAIVKTEIAVVPQEEKVLVQEEAKVIPQPIKELPKTELAVVPQQIETSSATSENIKREVMPKETKYGIAKQYGITVKELEKQNPEIKNNFPVGYKLTIHAANSSNENGVVSNPEKKKKEFKKPQEIDEENQSIDENNGEFKSFIKPLSNPNFLDELIETASANIGTRYQSGGTSKSGFDCSGLMCTTFGAFDIKLPRTSLEQSRLGVVVNTEDAQKGDLIFFKTNGRSRINHVGMVVEVCDGDIKFIHASVGGGVVISSVKEKYYEKKLTQINRVLQ